MHTIRLPEAERIPQIVEGARPALAAAVGVVDGALAGRDYMLGNEFTAADVMIGSTLGWARMMGAIGSERKATAAYLDRLMARPAWQRATA